MTERVSLISNKTAGERRKLRLQKRFASEKRFKVLGLGAVAIGLGFLIILMGAIIAKGWPAFTHHYGAISLDLPIFVDQKNPPTAKYSTAFKSGVKALFPFAKDRKGKRKARQIFTSNAVVVLKNQASSNSEQATNSTRQKFWLPLGDFADLYAKGLTAQSVSTVQSSSLLIAESDGLFTLASSQSAPFLEILSQTKKALGGKLNEYQRKLDSKNVEILAREKAMDNQRDGAQKTVLKQQLQKAQAQHAQLLKDRAGLKQRLDNPQAPEILDDTTPSVLLYLNNAILKIETISPDKITAAPLVSFQKISPQKISSWQSQFIATPQNSRKFSDIEIAMVETLRAQGALEKRWNTPFFTNGASREPEVAGILGALIGSLLTISVTLGIAFPLGVLAAIYLEEFAPKNRLTDIIEVNINNLAAVPSIIFGLLGLAIFLNWFNMPRSAPLVGGMVLALMTLPTIIIASRAALRAVPPSIREAALGIGASKIQSVFHHVLPMAMPGILTGTIIGLAQALGETAPLLMIGMVAFIADISTGLTDPATVMPVQIYMWADFPEPAFQQKTAAAILVLMVLLILINAIAVFLRSRFERRW